MIKQYQYLFVPEIIIKLIEVFSVDSENLKQNSLQQWFPAKSLDPNTHDSFTYSDLEKNIMK